MCYQVLLPEICTTSTSTVVKYVKATGKEMRSYCFLKLLYLQGRKTSV